MVARLDPDNSNRIPVDALVTSFEDDYEPLGLTTHTDRRHAIMTRPPFNTARRCITPCGMSRSAEVGAALAVHLQQEVMKCGGGGTSSSAEAAAAFGSARAAGGDQVWRWWRSAEVQHGLQQTDSWLDPSDPQKFLKSLHLAIL